MFRAFASFVLLVFLTSCAIFAPPPPATTEPPESFYELLASDLKGVRSYIAKGRLKLESPGRMVAGRLFLAGMSPDSIRLEVTSVMGNTLWAVVLSGPEALAYDGSSATFYRGRATRKNVAKLFNLPPTDPEDLYALAVGRVVPERVRLEIEGRGRFFLEDRYVLKFSHGLVKELAPLRGDDFRLEFQGTLKSGGVAFPQSLEVAYKDGTRLKIFYDEITLNPGVDRGIFTMTPPRGARLVDLGP